MSTLSGRYFGRGFDSRRVHDNARVAQLVESLFCTQEVGGSSPSAGYMPLKVEWPSSVAERAQVWRVLDLSGLTTSPRRSKNYTLAGYVYLDGRKVRSLRKEVKLGRTFLLEIRFPSGKIVSSEIFLVPRRASRKSRSNSARSLNYKG